MKNAEFGTVKEGEKLNDDIRKKVFREELKKRNNGMSMVEAKYIPCYPDRVEREYFRMVNSYMSIEKQIILKYIPELKQIISEGTIQLNKDSKKDNEQKRKHARFGRIALFTKIEELFEKIVRELKLTFGIFGIHTKLDQIAALEEKLSIKEWKKVISKTLGINLLEDYYSGAVYKELLEKWVSDNVDLIKTIPYSSLDKMKEIVYDNYMKGATTTNIVKAIQKQYGMDKRHARLIARDQVSKLNAAITQYQQKDAGITQYRWSTSKDERVRKGDKTAKGIIDPMGDNHERLEGKIFRWDKPPLVDRKRGRACHPGEDYQCRCCAIPVFNIDTLELPV